jgi:hypothetical protein
LQLGMHPAAQTGTGRETFDLDPWCNGDADMPVGVVYRYLHRD